MSYHSELTNNYNTDCNYYNSNNESTYYDGSSENYSSGYGSASYESVNNTNEPANYYGSYPSSYYDSSSFTNQAIGGGYYSNGYSNYNYYDTYYNQQQAANESNEILSSKDLINNNKCDIESVNVELTNESLWNKFHVHTTEMILTKQGRKMFPTLQYSISGMDSNKKYYIFVELVKVVPNSWKYQSGKWIQCAGLSQNETSNKHLVHMHPDSPNTGAFWMKNELLFAKLKLTNNNQIANENILLLNSMHKYMPKLHIVCADDLNSLVKKPKLSDFDSNCIKTVSFEQTQFIAVTAYLNRTITELKIEYNPFAKGFRETEQNCSSISSKTSPIVSPNSSKVLSASDNTTSTPKQTCSSNSYYFNQENLSPRWSYDLNTYNSNSLSPYSNEFYRNNFYYSYNNFYNTQAEIHQNYSILVSNNSNSNASNVDKNSKKRKYNETLTQEEVSNYYSNQLKQHCSNSYYNLRS